MSCVCKFNQWLLARAPMSGLSLWAGLPQEVQGQASREKEPDKNQATFDDPALEVRVTYLVLHLRRLSQSPSPMRDRGRLPSPLDEGVAKSWRACVTRSNALTILGNHRLSQPHHLATKILILQASKIHSSFPPRTP